MVSFFIFAKKAMKAYVFDFDDTLVKTDAKTRVYRNGVLVKTLTPSEYNNFKMTKDDECDFSEFENGDLIRNAQKYKGWKILQNISDKIKREETDSVIYILTARHDVVKPDIYYLLNTNEIEIHISNIITMGDGRGEINIPEEKKKILLNMSRYYEEIYFFDDNILSL